MRALKLCQWRTPANMFHKRINWMKLNGKNISNENVILSKYGDVHSHLNGPVFSCTTLFLDECDRNFVASWLNRRTFPNVKNIYVGSHIRQVNFLGNEFDEIWVKETTQEYKNQLRDSLDNKHLKIMSKDDYNAKINKYKRLSERIKY